MSFKIGVNGLKEDDKKHLENFLMDIDVLDELNAYLSDFNAFETLGIVNTEIRHSHVLGWLLNPNENHGLQDAFLKRFMQRVFYNFKEIPNSNLTLFDLTEMNFNTFLVRREWQHIDLLFYSEIDNVVVAIENKVWSKESEHQLTDYREIVQRDFADYNQIYLFLTPEGDEASDPENWLSINYASILEILEKVVSIKGNIINDPTKYFIKQYKDIIRRHIVGDKELEEVCRQIYFKHQKALDLIYEYKPDTYSEITTYLEEKINATKGLVLDTSTKKYIRFISTELDTLISKVDQGWTGSKRLLLFEFQNKDNRLVLKLSIRPGDQEKREAIYELAKKNKKTFRHVSKKLTPQYTQIYHIDFLLSNYEEDFDSIDKITKEIDKVFKRFIETELVQIENVLISEIKQITE